MTKKNLRTAFLVMLFAILWAGIGIFSTGKSEQASNNGTLIFENTVKNKDRFAKIALTTPKEKITFEYDSGLWFVKEADYYPANMEFLNKILTDIDNARYIGQQEFSHQSAETFSLLNPETASQGKGTLVETYDNNGKILDKIIVGTKNGRNNFTFVKPADKDEICLADGFFELPEEAYSWVMQPLIELPSTIFEKLQISEGNQFAEAQRSDVTYPFFYNDKVIQPDALLERFNYLIAEEFLSVQNFDENLFPNHRQIILTAFNGLILSVDLFHDTKNYWIKISLSSTVLSTTAVNDYIKENSFRYDGWYFRIPQPTGKVLANFSIM